MTPETYFNRNIDQLSDPKARRFPRPPLPPKEKIKRVHISAICGKAMAPLAGLLAAQGYKLSGSDQQYSPPMSDLLRDLSLPEKPFSAQNLEGVDLVIIGNALGPDNVECVAARERGLPYLSVAEALSFFILSGQDSVVVAGTHGKTTTTGLLVKLFQAAHQSPSFLVGGVVQGEDTAYALGEGKHFLIEGDEYDTAYFDKRPKFLHYQAKHLIVTSLELDHTDIYEGDEDYRQAFRFLVEGMPSDGTVLLCQDNEAVELTPSCVAPVTSYGFHPQSDLRITNHETGGGLQKFDLELAGDKLVHVVTPLSGRYNCLNIAAALGTAHHADLDLEQCLKVIRGFTGMKKRQELLAQNAEGVLLIDDYAHHPTAVDATLSGLRKQYGSERRLIALFEPRSNSSRRKDFEKDYPLSFQEADCVVLKAPEFRHNDDAANFMDPSSVISEIQKRGTTAELCATNKEIIAFLGDFVEPTDLLLTMSNGNFDGLQDDLIAHFRMQKPTL